MRRSGRVHVDTIISRSVCVLGRPIDNEQREAALCCTTRGGRVGVIQYLWEDGEPNWPPLDLLCPHRLNRLMSTVHHHAIVRTREWIVSVEIVSTSK